MNTGDQHRKYIGVQHENEVHSDPLRPEEDLPTPAALILGGVGKGKASLSDESLALVEKIATDARDKRPDIR